MGGKEKPSSQLIGLCSSINRLQVLPGTPRVESCFQAPRGAVISCSNKRPEQRAKGRFITRGPQTSQMRQMPACVCGTRKKGDSWVSRKSGDGKRQPGGPNLGDHHGTLEHEIRFRRERRAWFGRGLGKGVSARGLRGISGTVGLVLQRMKQVWGEGRYALGALVQSSHGPSSSRTCDPLSNRTWVHGSFLLFPFGPQQAQVWPSA